MMKPVLILGEEPRIVVNIARSLHRHGVPVDVAALSPDAPRIRSHAVRRSLLLPDPRQNAAFSYAALVDYIESERYDQLIPASDTALSMMADYYRDLAGLLHVACPPREIVQRVLNKALTLQVAQACQVPIPRSTTIATLGELDECGPALQFPVIAKPWGKGLRTMATFKIRRFETFRELRQAFVGDPKFGTHHLIQEYIPGEGVGIEVLMHDGHPLALFQHRRLKELPSTGGVSVLAVAEPVDPLLGGNAVRLLRGLQWEGVAMVEFRVHRATGRVALMEVNGRYWGSLRLSILAGVDFPWYEWQLAHGQRPDIPGHYRAGVSARWTSGAIQRLARGGAEDERPTVSRLGRELCGFVRDCLPQTRDLLWTIRDPQPGFFETMSVVRGLVRQGVKRVIMPIVPEALVSIRRRSRVLERRARRRYIMIAIARALGFNQARLPDCLEHVHSVLFVCHGNILRSPMAAGLFKKASDACGLAMEIHSAGLHANPFNGADPRGVMAAAELGVTLSGHRADPLTRDMVQGADAIVVMDQFNEAELLARYPDARNKLFCLGVCHTAMASCPDIQDPYRGDLDDVRQCYERIRTCIDGFIAKLSNASGKRGTEPTDYDGHPRGAPVAGSLRAGSVR